MSPRQHVGPGFWRQDDHGKLEPAAPEVPDCVISRRVEDFPGGVPPPRAIVINCDRCLRPIAWDGKFADRPHVCMQCAGIEPLPECYCRTAACGHGATAHGPGGVCRICKVACWS